MNVADALTIDPVLFACGALLLISVLASKASTRLGVPALVLFLVIGMLAGSEGPGGIVFDDPGFAKSLGTVALVLILFAGGMDTHWNSIKPVLAPGLSLATFGVLFTAGLVGSLAYLELGFTLEQALLLGAIVSSTDAAAVFAVLRAQSLRLRSNLVPLLELESGSNDPMAVFLTMGLTGIILNPGSGVAHFVPELFLEMAIGLGGGYFIGRAAALIMNRIHLEYDGLYPVLTISIAALSYASVQLVGGNGFLACYVAGVTLGSRNLVHRAALIQFHEGLSWLMQIAMFLCLGLLVFPSHLVPDAFASIGLSLFLIIVARPIAVMISLLPFRMPWQEKAFLAWVGLRGAVPIVLATIPLTHGIVGADRIFNCVFFIVVLSVIVQGLPIRWVARKLGVVTEGPQHVSERRVTSTMLEVIVPPNSHVVEKSVVELSLPESTLLILLTRGGDTFIPQGNTVLLPGDRLLIQSQGRSRDEIQDFFLKAK